MPSHLGRSTKEDPIRLKNLLRRAEQQLMDAGFKSPAVRQKLGPLRLLVNEQSFWQRQEGGLAMFVNGSVPHVYRVPLLLPEMVVVDSRFHLRPLLPLISGNGHFCIMALSQNSVRLFHASQFGVHEVDLPASVPPNMARTMAAVQEDKQAQFHTQTTMHGAAGPRPKQALFHGHGVSGADEAVDKMRMGEFCHQIEQGVSKLLSGMRCPLILAAAQPVAGIYQEGNTYPQLEREVIRGNPDRLSGGQLHKAGWAIMEPIFQQRKAAALAKYRQSSGPRVALSSKRLGDCLAAAQDGVIETLFVAMEDHRWGHFDPQSREVTLHRSRQEGDDDLLELTAAGVYLSGGTIFAIPKSQMPADSPVAATFRFSVAA